MSQKIKLQTIELALVCVTVKCFDISNIPHVNFFEQCSSIAETSQSRHTHLKASIFPDMGFNDAIEIHWKSTKFRQTETVDAFELKWHITLDERSLTTDRKLTESEKQGSSAIEKIAIEG